MKLQEKITDTKEQLIAQSLDRHLALTANAGSGKTYVLVNRYLNIFLNNESNSFTTPLDADQIVAITFTKKAASEMKAKVIKAIENKLKEDFPSERRNLLLKVRENLTYCKISTIHSFCESLLRDYPIEANVSPNFNIVSGAELIRLKNESISDRFNLWLDGSNPENESKLKTLLLSIDYLKLQSIITKLLNNPFILSQLNQFYIKTDEEILQLRNEYLANYIISYIIPIITKLVYILKTIDYPKLKNSEEYKYNLSKLEDIQKTDLSDKPIEFLANYWDDLNLFLKFFITNDFKIRSIYKKYINFNNPDEVENLSDSFKSYMLSDEIFKYINEDLNLIKIARIILEITNDCYDELERKKQQLGYLDFEDLMLKTNELLKNDTARKRITTNLKYLLVDEFQDTNDIQYEIIRNLVPELKTNEFSEIQPNLFIVGDAKQSIYSFRNADVRIFEKARKDIAYLNRLKIEQGLLSKRISLAKGFYENEKTTEMYGDINLTVTFRLQPVIASFVNFVCGNLMKEKRSDFDTEYNSFICSKNVDELLKIDKNSFLTKDFGSVSFLTNHIKSENNGNMEDFEEGDSSDNETDLLASHINYVLSSESDYFVYEKDGSKRKPQFSDIAILARKKKNFGKLVISLLQNKIPHIVHSGNDFFQSQEIIDIISFLNFLNNQKNDLALLSILRSPYFAFTDAELLMIATGNKFNSYWEKFKSFVENISNYHISESESIDFHISSEKLLRAYNLLNKILEYTPNMSISQLIILIQDLCAWYGTIVTNYGREQIKSNVEKFLEYSREYEKRGFRNLYDFVEELNYIFDNKIDDTEPANITGDNAVNILTIHSAKGLEFPIVYLFDTNTKLPQNEEVLMSKEFGITLSLPTIIDQKYKGVIKNTPLQYLSKRYDAASKEAEEKRLLYVALTRAKDHLIICSSFKTNKDNKISKSGFVKLLIDGLNNSDENFVDSIPLNITDNLTIMQGNELISLLINYSINFSNSVPVFSKLSEEESIKEHNKIFLMEEIKPNGISDMFSPTKLLSYIEDKDKYINDYVLGLPDEVDNNNITSKIDNKYNGEEIGSLSGTLIHRALEQIRVWVEPDGTVNDNALTQLIDSIIKSSEKSVKDNLKNRMFTECQNLVKTKLINSRINEVLEAKQEYQLIIPISSNYLTGAIDLLVKVPSGNYEIWDWKTNRIDNKETLEKLSNHYQFQMKVYSYFLMLLQKEQNDFSAKLLFTRLAFENAEDSEWIKEFKWGRAELIEFGKEINDKINEIINEFHLTE